MTFGVNRRQFLAASVGALMGHGLLAKELPFRSSRSRGRLLTQYLVEGGESSRSGALVMDLDQGTLADIKIPTAIHKFSIALSKPTEAIGIASYENFIAKIDLKDPSLIEFKKTPEKYDLNGHVEWVEDLGRIYASANKGKDGGVVGLNPSTLEFTDEVFPGVLNQSFTHDLKFINQSKALLVSGGNHIVYLDLANKKVIHHNEIEFDIPGPSLNHFAISKEGNLGIQSNSIRSLGSKNKAVVEDGALVTFNNKQQQFHIHRPKGLLAQQMKSDLFGLCFNNEGTILAVLNPYEDFISFWNFTTGTIEKKLTISGQMPTGISVTSNGEFFVVVSFDGLRYFHTKTLHEDQSLPRFKAEFSTIFSSRHSRRRLFHTTSYLS